MSRIGNKPIEIPAGIDVKVEGNTVTVSGKGITPEPDHRQPHRSKDGRQCNAHYPCKRRKKRPRACTACTARRSTIWWRASIKGFSKELEINGVGYRAAKQGNELVMNLGYSHQVVVPEIPGITIEVPRSQQSNRKRR